MSSVSIFQLKMASVGVQALRGRLGAARLTLASVAQHPAALAGTSRIEAKATCELLDRYADTLTDEERTLLISVVIETQFAPSDAEFLISRVVATGGSVKCRRKQQDFTLFYVFLDRVRWMIFQAKDRPVADKENTLICFLKDLGLRLPSEPTFKVASSFLLLVTESWEDVSRMSLPYKKAALSRLKSNWRVAVRNVPAPRTWIQNLPKTTSEFQASCPLEWSSLYGAGGPVPPEIDIVRLHMLDSSYKCRAYEHNDSPSAVPTIANSHGVVGGLNNPSLNSLEAFAGMFMKGLTEMQAQQSRMAELMFGGGGGGGGYHAGNRPRGLQDLLDQSPAPSPRPKMFPIMNGESPGSASSSSGDVVLHFDPGQTGAHSQPRPGQAGVHLQPPPEHAVMQEQPLPGLALQQGHRPQPLPPPVGNGQTAILSTPVVGAVRPTFGAVDPAVGADEDDEVDDAPLSMLVVAKKKEPTAAEAAEARAEAMLDRMKQREQLKKSQKAAAKDAADVGGVVAALGDTAAKKGPGRPRGTKMKAPGAEAPKRVRIKGKSSPK